MEVRYSAHLRFRMQVRNIPESMPEQIYWEGQQRFYDHHSLRHIRIMEVYYGRRRTLMMIAYDQFPDHAMIMTVHPITRTQIKNRLQTGRWEYE